ncbi:glycoside hydrolase family 43 protein [Flavivirga spongiicola]|uniref:Glycoside hydrolase family 43 protein n=1 Tax=Flavivirga spongiicola TaxID=421621 RepID=A0ABU7XT45_9FLAO|nr:glycoside hydrolase family 43 protein [Flavivirga sp. MEBiC05379]MDO5978955.1 glycoside hydrolase family 43 protein [Flavivirga sp. MEBiC05379]
MNKYLLIIILIIVFGCKDTESDVYLFSYFKNNGEDGLHLAYSKDGLKWTAINNNESVLKPTVGNDKLMRDPCIIKGGDNKFHMVWTVSWNEKGIGYANSTDLIHWSEQKYIPVMHHEPNARNCWAPELFFDEDSQEYLINWATTIPGRFQKTDSLGDNGYNHRMYYTTTKDFVEFADTKLFYDQGFNVIDAHLQKDNNRYLMFLKDETLLPHAQKNIRIATSNELQGNYSEPSKPISTNWVEGPTSIKINGEWIVYFDMYTKHKMGAVKSSDLINWTDLSDKIIFPEGTRHGTVFKVTEGTLKRIISLHNNVSKK